MGAREDLQADLDELIEEFGRTCEYEDEEFKGLVTAKETATDFDPGFEISNATLRVLVSKTALEEKPPEQSDFTADGVVYRVVRSTEYGPNWFRVYLTNINDDEQEAPAEEEDDE